MTAYSRSKLAYYRDSGSKKRYRLRVLRRVCAILLAYFLITTFFVESWRMETDSMSPGYPADSRVFVNPYLPRAKDGALRTPPRRGDFIVFRPPYMEARPWYLRFVDSLIRLLTFQKLMLGSFSYEKWENDLMFKRVIAVPGDTVRMEKSIAYIKGVGDDFFISEFESSGIAYDLIIEALPRGWTSSMPLSGDMDSILMSEGEYFVLGDNRTASNDSRYWGVLTSDRLYGRVFFLYWPLGSFGRIQ